jgi:hypothetical protein
VVLKRNCRGLRIEIGRSTVANILVEAGIDPAPERIHKRPWKQFLRSHWETLYACGFFAVETRVMVLFVIALGRSKTAHTGLLLRRQVSNADCRNRVPSAQLQNVR